MMGATAVSPPPVFFPLMFFFPPLPFCPRGENKGGAASDRRRATPRGESGRLLGRRGTRAIPRIPCGPPSVRAGRGEIFRPPSFSYPRKIISIAGVSRITQGKGSRMVAPARGGGGSCVESLGLYQGMLKFALLFQV